MYIDIITVLSIFVVKYANKYKRSKFPKCL